MIALTIFDQITTIIINIPTDLYEKLTIINIKKYLKNKNINNISSLICVNDDNFDIELCDNDKLIDNNITKMKIIRKKIIQEFNFTNDDLTYIDHDEKILNNSPFFNHNETVDYLRTNPHNNLLYGPAKPTYNPDFPYGNPSKPNIPFNDPLKPQIPFNPTQPIYPSIPFDTKNV